MDLRTQNSNELRDAHLSDEPAALAKSELRPVPQRLVYSEKSRQARLDHLEASGLRLSEMRAMRLDPGALRGNIECLIGAVEIPVGAAGPLSVHGQAGTADIFAPIATSEGALLSSINRGCRALQMSGGVTARTLKQRMSRAPFFDCGSLTECLRLKGWFEGHRAEIQHKVRQFSNHAVLVDLEIRLIPPCMHVRFVFETGDAAGQNMATVCTWNTCRWILRRLDDELPGVVKSFVIDGNLSTDKKASYLSAYSGRGYEVIAEAIIPDAVVRRVLHSTSAEMARVWSQVQATGILTGVHGLNINAANVVAGIFAATGQDIACVHESSTAQFHLEARPEGLYASVYLPSLVIGTVGGGVGLAIQRQLLEMMGCYGPHKGSRFAEMVASYVLALELSTGAALVGGQFASAHERLGRNKSSHWLGKADLNTNFFDPLVRRPVEWGAIVAAKPVDLEDDGGSLVVDLTSQISRRPCGLWAYELRYANLVPQQKIFVKSKVSDRELLLAFEIMAGVSSPGLGELLRENSADNPFNGFHIRELKIAEMTAAPLVDIMPRTFGTCMDGKSESYILVQEFLHGLELFNAVEKRASWTQTHLQVAIAQIAKVHAHFLNQTTELEAEEWMFTMNRARVERLAETHFELAQHLKAGGYDWFSDADLEFHRQHLRTWPRAWSEIESMPKTLVHNDFNPRNLGFRRFENNRLHLVAYDWELATIHIPQRDVVELLAFTLNEATPAAQIENLLEFHRVQVEANALTPLAPNQWRRGCALACLDLLLQRLPIYGIAQTFRAVNFLRPSYRTARHMYQVLQRGVL